MGPARMTDPPVPPSVPLRAVDLAFRTAAGGPLAMGVMFDFSGEAPPLSALRARIAARAGHLPALRYRVRMHDKTAYPVAEVDPADHVRELVVADAAELNAARRQMLALPLPEGRPSWDVWLIRWAQKSFTVCFRSDHALRDAIAAANLCRLLIEDDPQLCSSPSPAGPVTLRGVATALAESARSLRSFDLAPAFGGAEAGTSRLFHTDTPLALLRTAARAHVATVNDVYLAALSAAVCRWHREGTHQGHPPMPVTMPLSVRPPDQSTTVGNALVGTRLTLPCESSGSVQEALAAVTARTRRLREMNYRQSAGAVLGVLPRSLGARLVARVAGAGSVGMLASNLNCGPSLTHFGVTARQAEMFSALAGGLRCYTALTGYGDNARLTVVHDDSLTHLPLLGKHWVAAVHELATPVDRRADEHIIRRRDTIAHVR